MTRGDVPPAQRRLGTTQETWSQQGRAFGTACFVLSGVLAVWFVLGVVALLT